MPRSRSRPGRSSGKSDRDKNESPKYTGRSSWPIVEWSAKHELSKMGLAGSIVLHEIKRPAPSTNTTAAAPSSAAPSAATSTRTSTSTPASNSSTGIDTAARAPQEAKADDGTAPAGLNAIQAQLQALQLQFRDLQTSLQADADSDSDGDEQVEMTQIADSISALNASLQSALTSSSRTPTTPVSLDTSTTLDAALKDAGDRHKKV